MPPYAGLEYFRVYTAVASHVMHVPLGQGDGVCAHLRAQHIASRVSASDEKSYDRIEFERDVSAQALRQAIDQWQA